MLTLYYYPICPLSRQIRVLLKEFNHKFTIVKENYWLNKQNTDKINPFGSAPMIKSHQDFGPIIGNYAIIEHMVENFDNFYLMPKSCHERLLVRQNITWFNDQFFHLISSVLVEEKITRLLKRIGGPRSDYIRDAKLHLNQHFKLLSDLLEEKSFITSDQISCADIVAASHISTIDYFGEISWGNWPLIKKWYAIIKSRPSFQSILQEQIAGFPPPPHYSDLDF